VDKKNLKIWKKIDKLPGGDQDPFETPIGPTNECLTASQVANYVRVTEKDPRIVKHIIVCDFCHGRIISLRDIIEK